MLGLKEITSVICKVHIVVHCVTDVGKEVLPLIALIIFEMH